MAKCGCTNTKGPCGKFRKKLLTLKSDLITISRDCPSCKTPEYDTYIQAIQETLTEEDCPDSSFVNMVINFVADEHRKHNKQT